MGPRRAGKRPKGGRPPRPDSPFIAQDLARIYYLLGPIKRRPWRLRSHAAGASETDDAWPWRIAAEARRAWAEAGWDHDVPELGAIFPEEGLRTELCACSEPRDADEPEQVGYRRGLGLTGRVRWQFLLTVPNAGVRVRIPMVPERARCHLCAFVA